MYQRFSQYLMLWVDYFRCFYFELNKDDYCINNDDTSMGIVTIFVVIFKILYFIFYILNNKNVSRH